jgi:hypothetical protein
MQTKQIRAIAWLLILTGILVAVFGYVPLWLKRHNERQEVLNRVQSAGGWNALRQACESYASNHLHSDSWQSPGTGVFVYVNGHTKEPYATNYLHESVPPEFAALKPQSVYYHSPEGFIKPAGFSEIPVIQIGFLGTHRAFSIDNSMPFYGLEVACGINANDYVPQPSNTRFSSNWFPLDWYSHHRKVTEGIYEIY